MNGPRRREKGTSPWAPCHSQENEIQQYGRSCVKKDISEVVSPCPEPVNLTIQHVADPRQRMPVIYLVFRKCPTPSAYREPIRHGWVILDIEIVVEIDESIANGFSERDKYQRDQ